MKQIFSKQIISDAYWATSYKIHNNPALVLELTAEQLLEFTDKQSYLEWVKSWKAFYKGLADRQRELRLELKKPHGTLGFAAGVLMSERQTNKWYLRILLEARRIAKRRSWQMKQDRKMMQT